LPAFPPKIEYFWDEGVEDSVREFGFVKHNQSPDLPLSHTSGLVKISAICGCSGRESS